MPKKIKEQPEYISLQEATKYCSYSQEYLALRARQGKLKSIKIGRNWATTKEWLEEYLREIKEEPKLISLQDATKYCSYSQEYLSLLARLGKLRSVKLGRNWVTTNEWLTEYLKRIEEHNNNFRNNLKPAKIVPSPQNLPVEILPRTIWQGWSLGLAIFSILILLMFGVIFSSGSIISMFKDINSYTLKINEVTFLGLAGVNQLAKSTQELPELIPEIVKRMTLGTKNIFLSLIENFSNLVFKHKTTKEGLVIVPSTERDEETKKKIKESLSDKVIIESKDETSGIITPVFRDREGEKYLYLLVPINQ